MATKARIPAGRALSRPAFLNDPAPPEPPPVREAPLPFGMQPAPIRKDAAKYLPVDLGQYDPDLAGWCVIYDPGAPIMLIVELADVMADSNAVPKARMQAMQEYLAAVLVAWNFTRIAGDSVETLPQPRDGGAIHCPQHALKAIGQGFADAIKPPKD